MIHTTRNAAGRPGREVFSSELLLVIMAWGQGNLILDVAPLSPLTPVQVAVGECTTLQSPMASDSIACRRDAAESLDLLKLNRMQRQLAAWLGSLLWLLPGAALASAPPACGSAVQLRANQSLASLEQRQQVEDQALRNHPTASYSTMNGPVLRELEKRHQREALVQQLQAEALKKNHCSLTVE